MNLDHVVFIAGMCWIAGVVSRDMIYLPAFLALIFPAYPREAAMVGMVTSLLFGAATKFVKSGR